MNLQRAVRILSTSNVIVGNGCAAIEAIRAMRDKGFSGEIHLFSDSMRPSYNPMLTTYYASGKIDFEACFPFGYNDEFYKEHQVQMHFGSPVTKVDTEKKTVENDAGVKTEYDNCLIASGANPILPPIEGINSKKVFAMRTIEDAISLKEELKNNPKKALVIGASMVGIKVAELLNDRGIEVCLADMAPHIFPLAAHPTCAHIIEERVRARGVRLRFRSAIQGVEESSKGLRAHFSGGEVEEADFLVMCVGVRACCGFLDTEKVDIDRGILVDDAMRTNVPGLYAAGDATQGTNILTGQKEVIGLWANARYQGRTAGRNMAGIKDLYPGNIPHNITHFMDMVFAGIGSMTGGTREEIEKADSSYVHLVWDKERLIGVNLLGECEGVGVIRNALHKSVLTKTPLSEQNLCWNKLINSIYLKHYSKWGISTRI